MHIKLSVSMSSPSAPPATWGRPWTLWADLYLCPWLATAPCCCVCPLPLLPGASEGWCCCQSLFSAQPNLLQDSGPTVYPSCYPQICQVSKQKAALFFILVPWCTMMWKAWKFFFLGSLSCQPELEENITFKYIVSCQWHNIFWLSISFLTFRTGVTLTVKFKQREFPSSRALSHPHTLTAVTFKFLPHLPSRPGSVPDKTFT